MKIDIHEVRLKLMMSQKELADALGITDITVSAWENGKSKPSLKHKRKLIELCKNKNIDIKEKNG